MGTRTENREERLHFLCSAISALQLLSLAVSESSFAGVLESGRREGRKAHISYWTSLPVILSLGSPQGGTQMLPSQGGMFMGTWEAPHKALSSTPSLTSVGGTLSGCPYMAPPQSLPAVAHPITSHCGAPTPSRQLTFHGTHAVPRKLTHPCNAKSWECSLTALSCPLSCTCHHWW